jgi:hypothetical protein
MSQEVPDCKRQVPDIVGEESRTFSMTFVIGKQKCVTLGATEAASSM